MNNYPNPAYGAAPAPKKRRRFPGFIIPIAVIALSAVATLVFNLCFCVAVVGGTSMEHTLKSGDIVLVTRLDRKPADGDIVMVSHGETYSEPIIKRVIATEGQTLQLDYENDRIIVDGIEIEESYIKGTTFSENYGNYQIPEVIPKGKIFVMGDNRHVSLDSRSSDIGLIDISSVIGKAQFVAWPPADFGYLY